MYGKELAGWLKDRLTQTGYDVEDIIPEDWGWCVMCSRKPFMLWVGCGSVCDDGEAEEGAPPPRIRNITWSCFVEAEVPIFKRLFKKPDTAEARGKLIRDVKMILESEKEIEMVEGVYDIK